MEFRILGPLEVVGPDGPIAIGSARQRTILAALVLRVGETVPTDRLIDELWPDDPPTGATHTLAVHLSGLRGLLGGSVIETTNGGYRLRGDGADIDLRRFERLVDAASQATGRGDPESASRALAEALALWRGPALGDLSGALAGDRARLDEVHGLAVERWIDAELACGRHQALVPELRRLVGAEPTSEPLHARLMLALYRSGRQGDALAAYHAARATLGDQLGVDPGPELESLQRAILAQDSSLAPNVEHPPAQPSSFPVAPQAATPLDHPTRRTVTTIVVGLTATMPDGRPLDPEAGQAVLDRTFGLVATILARHGATVQRLTGETLIAVLGMPAVHEDDPLRAMRASIEARAAIAEVSHATGPAHPVRVAIRIGISSGEVVAAGGTSSSHLVAGTTVRIASRLQEAASPGEILVERGTHRRVRDAVEVGPDSEVNFGADLPPIAAHRLERLSGDAGRPRPSGAPMVGRERELAALQRSLEQVVRTGACQLVTVVGPAGIGKSRLIAEFLGTAPERVAIFQARCLPYGDGITYWPAAEIVRQMTGIDSTDTAAMARARINAFCVGVTEAGAVARGLAGLVALDTDVERLELMWAFRRMLEAASEARPAVVVIEDVHWAETALVELLHSVADHGRASRILLICTARPEFLADQPTWGGGLVNAATMLIEPLEAESAYALLDSLTPWADLPANVRARIADAAEGNPLFVEEFLGMLVDDGLLDDGRRLGEHAIDIDRMPIPPTIQALLSARLDRLEAGECAAAERASVIGRVFQEAAVVALSPPEARPQATADLQSLIRRELIRPDRSELSSERAYRFRHMLIRDAAYARLLKAERAELHERFATWLEDERGDRLREVQEIVAYHLEQAHRYRIEIGATDAATRDLGGRAAGHLVEAGRRAFARSDYAGAVNLLERADRLLSPSDPTRLAMLADLGRALDQQGRTEEARARYREAAEHLRRGDEAARARAQLLLLLTELDGAALPQLERRRRAGELIATLRRQRDERGLAEALHVIAGAWNAEGRPAKELPLLEVALVHAKLAGDHHRANLILFDIGFDLVQGPMPVNEAIRRCEAIRDGTPDERAVEMAMTHALAHLCARLGAFEEARAHAARCHQILREQGQVVVDALLTEISWDIETLAGDDVAAERAVADGYARLLAIGGGGSDILAAFLIRSRVALGRPMDLPAIAELAEKARGWPLALVEGALATAEAKDGKFGSAEAHVRRALDYLAASDFTTMHADARVILGDLLRQTNRGTEAEQAFKRALDLYRAKGSLVGAALAESRLAALEAQAVG